MTATVMLAVKEAKLKPGHEDPQETTGILGATWERFGGQMKFCFSKRQELNDQRCRCRKMRVEKGKTVTRKTKG